MTENENTDNSSLASICYSQDINKKKGKIIKENISSKIIKIIGGLLSDICKENKPNKEETLFLLQPFIMKKIPPISIEDFLERLLKYSKVSHEVFILTLIYIDRICNYYKFNLNYNIIHKLILASFITSIKFLEDDFYSMDIYAKIGGVSKKEIIYLEYEFLKLIKFNLFVKENLFDLYKSNLNNVENDYDEE